MSARRYERLPAAVRLPAAARLPAIGLLDVRRRPPLPEQRAGASATTTLRFGRSGCSRGRRCRRRRRRGIRSGRRPPEPSTCQWSDNTTDGGLASRSASPPAAARRGFRRFFTLFTTLGDAASDLFLFFTADADADATDRPWFLPERPQPLLALP